MKATSVVFDTDAGTDDLMALAFLPSRRDAARQPLARMVVQILELMGALLDADETFAWDPLAAVSLVDPAVLSTRRRRVEIRLSAPEEGRSVAVPGDGGNVDVAFAADERRFRDVFRAQPRGSSRSRLIENLRAFAHRIDPRTMRTPRLRNRDPPGILIARTTQVAAADEAKRNLPVHLERMSEPCDPFGFPSTSRWMGATIIA